MHHLIRLLVRIVLWAFYPVLGTSRRDRIPLEGPVIVVANHPNGLLDPIVAEAALGRRLSFLAKSTLFGHWLGRATMRAFSAIPVFRPKDGQDTSRNAETFRRCHSLLANGGWLMLFPEGTSHSDPQLRPLKTGAARIALESDPATGHSAGLRILPVGLLYEDKATFRSRVAVTVGEPLELGEFRDHYAREPRAAVEALTARIDEALSEVVLEADSRELQRGFVAVAAWLSDDAGADVAALEARARGYAQAFSRLRAKDPAAAERLVDETRRFASELTAVGLDDPFALEARLGPTRVLGFVLPLLAWAPLAVAGALLGWLPYRLIGVLSTRLTDEEDVVSTIKAVGGLVLLLPWWLAQAALGGWLWGWPVGLVLAGAGPLSGYAAVRFDERLARRRALFRGLRLRATSAEVAEAIRARRQQLAVAVSRALASVDDQAV